jgi:hypothetical protein
MGETLGELGETKRAPIGALRGYEICKILILSFIFSGTIARFYENRSN